MHELAVTEDLVRTVTEYAERAQARKVKAIHLVVGAMTGFVEESIRFYFEAITPGTLLDGAELYVEHRPVRFRCRRCGTEFEPPEMDWRCPQCGAVGGEVITGKEFLLKSIEVVT